MNDDMIGEIEDMDDGNMWYQDANGDICERFDISSTGYGLLDGYGADIYCVDDAVERFLETISWIDRKIEEVMEGIRLTGENAMEYPLEIDYDKTFDTLGLDLKYYSDLRDILQKDLNSITGHQVPW